jgi:excisionase family DNA binding protein
MSLSFVAAVNSEAGKELARITDTVLAEGSQEQLVSYGAMLACCTTLITAAIRPSPPEPPDDDELLTPQQCAAQLGVSKATVLRGIKRGAIKAAPSLPGTRGLRIKRSELRRSTARDSLGKP